MQSHAYALRRQRPQVRIPSGILGLFQETPASQTVNKVQVNQVNIGQNNALEAARRLAFALAKPARLRSVSGPTIEGHAVDAGLKE
jgi:hypothetical protein